MRTVILILIFLILLIPSIVFAEGTHTFSQVKSLDVTASYLDINKIVITKEIIESAGNKEEKVCLAIDDKYKITDTKEIILLLLEIITDMKKKP